MQKTCFIITGLGYGDEGKGSIVDWLSATNPVHTVIRTGGPQALHRVVTSDGREHVFSQFGSGSLRGVKTHLSREMLVAPSALLREGKILQHQCQHPVFEGLTIHEDALLVTPVQAITGRVRELLRGDNRRGSVGVGVGETVRDAAVLGDLALRAKDLVSPDLEEKLYALWQRKRLEYESYADRASGLPELAGTMIRAELAQINYDLHAKTLKAFTTLAKQVAAVNDEYVADKILGPEGTIVIEGSQGVLLDREYGVYPYTTKVRSVPNTAQTLLEAGRYTGHVQSLGIVRSYATRHGHGPFVTEDATLTERLPDARNQNDPWQGNFRIGHYDAALTAYASTVCGQDAFDGLVITCLDRTAQLDEWSVCTHYQAPSLGGGYGSIASLCNHLAPDHLISNLLSECRPIMHTINQRPLSIELRRQQQVEMIKSLVSLPVYATSIGTTEKDKFLSAR